MPRHATPTLVLRQFYFPNLLATLSRSGQLLSQILVQPRASSTLLDAPNLSVPVCEMGRGGEA